MRQHTVIGAELLAGDDSHLMVMPREIALTHHEKWNGGGYPRGLSGKIFRSPGVLSPWRMCLMR